jgi:4-amino-4-deoxy-L-arabinose transferase-like glycosyltransferase
MLSIKKLARIKKSNLYPIVLLTLIGLFFRLWKIKSFQYWSDDEQLFWYTVRHIIVDGHPSLVVVNTALGISLGSLYHLLISPWYFLTKFNPQLILLLGNVFFIASLLAIYKAGNLIGGRKTAFIASFLYSASFISSLFDRRLWALTPNFLVTTLSIIALFGLTSGKKKYLYLLLPAFILPFNSDPSLLVALIASIAAIILLKIKFGRKHLVTFTLFLLILLSPLIIFEIRHGGQNIKSIQNLITSKNPDTKRDTNSLFLVDQLGYFSRFIYSRPSKTSEIYFCYCNIEDNKNILPTVISTLIIMFFIFKTIKSKDKKDIILTIFLITYVSGTFLFKTALSRNSEFFYSLVISPIVFLIFAKTLSIKNKLVLAILLTFYLALNLHSLTNSKLKYPLEEKIKLTEAVTNQFNLNENFSLYYSGDIFLAGGGWTSLFTFKDETPVQGSLIKYWGHAYLSYGLYPKEFSKIEPPTVIILSENATAINLPVKNQGKVGNVYATIIDNRKKLFNPDINVEKLYIPKYFY